MPFGQEYWNERNTSRCKLLKGWVIVLSVERAGDEVRLSYPTRAESLSRGCQPWCWKLRCGFQTLYSWNTCKICQKYCFIMTCTEPKWDHRHAKQLATVARIKLNNHSLCMQLPEELELPSHAGCLLRKWETGQLHKSDDLVWCYYSFMS